MWLAPHLIHPLECIMPIYGYGLKGKEAMRVGLNLYDALSKSRNELPDESKHIPNSRIIPKNEVSQFIPNIDLRGLRGGALWHDGYCYNTERLVISFLKSASKNEAVVANYVKALNLNSSDNVKTEVEACDELSSETFTIQAKNVANCTGISDDGTPVFLSIGNKKESIKCVVGINLVVRKLFPKSTAVGLQNRRGDTSRLYFILPWRGKSVLGTEWFSINNNESFTITEKHINQLIKNFNETYPSANLSLSDVSFIHQGVVPGNGAYAGDISTLKKYRILDESNHGVKGLISVVGIKYTTAIHVAEQVMKKIIPSFKSQGLFNQPRLVDGEIDNFNDFKSKMIRAWQKYYEAKDIERTVFNYGTQSEDIIKNSISGEKKNESVSKARLIEQEVLNAIENEMAIRLSDTVLRRTDIGTKEMPNGNEIDLISKIMAKKIGWSEEKRIKEIEELKKFYSRFDIN
jgi:glycerol-3-phosphate dehydrogenase